MNVSKNTHTHTQTHTNTRTHVVQPDHITNTNARGSAYIHIYKHLAEGRGRKRNNTVCGVVQTKSYRSVGNYLGKIIREEKSGADERVKFNHFLH